MNTIPKQLPEELKTHHCFNDIHHAMFLILFVDLFDAFQRGRRRSVEAYIDNITIYLFIHFLAEEEGMAYSLRHHGHERDWIHTHTGIHVKFVKWWHQEVLKPFKDGSLDYGVLSEKCIDFCKQIIDHIDSIDLNTYGPTKRHFQVNHNETAHVSLSRLPLSPYQPGAYDIVKALAPRMCSMLAEESISPAARLSLPDLRLCDYQDNLWADGNGAFRDVFVGAVRTYDHRFAA